MVGRRVLIDVGTTKVKILIIDGKTRRYITYRPARVGDGAIDPRSIVEPIEDALGEGDAEIYLTGQRASAMGWWRDGAVTPLYTWRSPISERIYREVRPWEDPLLKIFLQPASAALRMKYVEEAYRPEYIGGIESYIVYKLFRENIVDYSYAHTYGLLDPTSLEYIDLIIETLDIDHEKLPTPVDTIGMEIGNSGYSLGSMIADQSAALIGEAQPVKGVGKITLGTGAFIDISTGGSIVGDLENGVIPIICYSDGRDTVYMTEVFTYSWGDTLDTNLKALGMDYDEISYVDGMRYKGGVIKEILYTSRYWGEVRPKPYNIDIQDLILSLATSIRLLYDMISGYVGVERLYLNGGGALSESIASYIASLIDVEIYTRSEPEKAALYGAYLYPILRRDRDEYMEMLDMLRPARRVEPRAHPDMDRCVARHREAMEELYRS